MNKNKFYVTTPIYYVNAKPHLGTLYSTLLADIAARWNVLQGKKVLFLTGLDEHGQKVQERAKSLNMTPQQLADSMVPAFKDVWNQYEFSYDHFIRTTDKAHVQAVTTWIKTLQEKGDIYKSVYSGWYCVPCETFVTILGEERICPSCGRQLQEVEEESYFFRLSAYQEQLLKFYEEHPQFITPKERLNEVIAFVRSGLKDLSISRKTVSWGIPFPGDESHTVYVWGDALNNYISAIGYGQKDKQQEFDFWWPADLHVMAKDIVRFHAVYWPAFLMAAGLAMPKKLLVHGYILSDEEKMSKSKGNVVDPAELAKIYGVEPIRFYLARKMAVTQDGHFNVEDLEKTIAADLSNSLGNLLNRMVTLALNNKLHEVKPSEGLEASGALLREQCEEAFRSFWDDMNHCQYHVALADVFKFVSQINAYFHEQKPWELVKSNKELFCEVMSCVCHSLYSVAIMLWPVMPKKMEELLASLGMIIEKETNYEHILRKNEWNKTFTLHKNGDGPLFPRPESKS